MLTFLYFIYIWYQDPYQCPHSGKCRFSRSINLVPACSYVCSVIHFVLAVWLETTLRIWWGHWRMVYPMWTVMGLLRAKQRVPKMEQGAARGEEEEEKQLFELAYLAEWLMTIIGLVNIVPMQMLGLPPHARCAINSGDETWILHRNKCLLPQSGQCSKS